MTPSASVTAVECHFGDVVAVDGVTFQVKPGEIVGLLGANGAGKTTLIRVLLGLIPASAGTVSLFGLPPGRAARRRLGYMPQGSGLYQDLTVGENLDFVSRAFGMHRSVPADLTGVANRLVSDLPLGIRKRVGFAAATIHDADLLVLDEPTSGVGPLARAELWEGIHGAAEAGAAVLVTTHYMDEAEQCDRLVVLAAGREVASGTVADIVGDVTTLELEVADPAKVLDLLEADGMLVLPAGHRLRVPGGDAARIRRLLTDAEPVVSLQSASLEEAFMLLSSSRS